MDYQSTNIVEIWKKLTILTADSIKDIDNALEEQSLKIDVFYNNLLQSAQKNVSDYVPEKKMSKRQSNTKTEQVGDLFSAQSGFQQPAVPSIRRTRRQASIAAMDKKKSVRESTIISFETATRASRARALSTFMDTDLIDGPKANSTFVVNKKSKENINECLSPEMFPLENRNSNNHNKTYDISTKCAAKKVPSKLVKNMNIIPEESPTNEKNNFPSNQFSTKVDSNIKSKETPVMKQREKLEDIQVNIEEPSRHLTRTLKRKLKEDNKIDAKKTNVVHVLLEKQISTPLKPIEDLFQQTPHQIRENEAEKRKELYLKTKADQKKFDNQHLKAAKQREEQMKRVEEKFKKAAEEKRVKEEKQKEKELMVKEEALKKQKQAEIRLAEINAKRKQAEEMKLIKVQKAEMDRKLKENELKKKNEIKPEKTKPKTVKTVSSNVSKAVTLLKPKVEKNETNTNDYGLNDVSARDSSEDESGPKKPVPDWAKRENRTLVLEFQYHVDSRERDSFFDCPKSVSLKEVFKGWNIRDRQRTSSAVWNTPIRYSEYIRKH